jgi:hypothetical protein
VVSFAGNVADYLAAIDIGNRFSLVGFATSATVLQPLGAKSAFRAKLDDSEYTGGLTNTGSAISTCAGTLAGSTAAKKIILLITDGKPTVRRDGIFCLSCEQALTYASEEALNFQNGGGTLASVFVAAGGPNSVDDRAFLASISNPGFAFSAAANEVNDILEQVMGSISCV